MSKIQWTEETWNPLVGCSKISEGCRNCYAINQAYRNAAMGAKLESPGRLKYYEGLTEKRGDRVEWTGKVNFVSEALEIPLKTKKPTTWFVNSMSDLFHESVSDSNIHKTFSVMMDCPQHTFQVLTKRPERMRDWVNKTILGAVSLSMYPLKNVWLGVTVENQKAADDRIPLLLQTSAAVRWLSCEPLLESIDLTRWTHLPPCPQHPNERSAGWGHLKCDCREWFNKQVANGRPAIRWVVVGGESGHNARPCNIEWIRSIVNQCKEADVPVFVKQLGSVPVIREYTTEEYRQKQSPEFEFPEGTMFGNKTGDSKLNGRQVLLRDRKGGDINEFPKDLQIREFPKQ